VSHVLLFSFVGSSHCPRALENTVKRELWSAASAQTVAALGAPPVRTHVSYPSPTLAATAVVSAVFVVRITFFVVLNVFFGYELLRLVSLLIFFRFLKQVITYHFLALLDVLIHLLYTR